MMNSSSRKKKNEKRKEVISTNKFINNKNIIHIILLTLIIIIFSSYQWNIIKDMKQIPACLFGCDHYNHLGRVHHLYDGGSFFEDHATKYENPWIPSGYHFMIFLFGKIFFLEPHVAFNLFTLISGALCIIVIFFLFREIFKNELYGYLAIPFFIYRFPIFKYTDFAMLIGMPFFFYLFLRFYKEKTKKNAIYVGLIFGLIGIINSNAFLTLIFFIMCSFFIIFIPELKRIRSKNLKEIWNKTKDNLIIPFTIITLIGVSIGMLFWFKPIFIDNLHIMNIQSEYDYADLSNPDIFKKEVVLWINSIFFRFNSPLSILYSLSALASVFFILIVKSKGELKLKHDYLRLIFFSSLFAVYSFIIMYPLTGINLFPERMFIFTFTTIQIIFIFFSLYFLLLIFNKIAKEESHKKLITIVLILFFIITIALPLSIKNFKDNLKHIKEDRFFQTAYTNLDPVRSTIQDWIKTNTDVRDVFLTTNELGFMLNGITGRKMMTFRRSHASQFLDFDKIMIDAAVMIYGNDSKKTNELLKEYEIDYFYWDYYWFNTEYHYDENGQIRNIFDPFVAKDNPENREYLDKYGINYFTHHWFIDPGVQGDTIKKYDLLFITPYSMNYTKPWSPALDNYLEEKKIIKSGEDYYAAIYKIKKI